jgi:hypothetical protein
MPVPVRVYGENGEQLDVILDNNMNNQIFNVSVPFEVVDIAFDPERHIVSMGTTASLANTEFDMLQSVSLYPNPVADLLNLSVPSDVSITSAVVQNVLGQQVLILDSQQTSWDVSQLSVGIHFLKVATSAGSKTFKFIKK